MCQILRALYGNKQVLHVCALCTSLASRQHVPDEIAGVHHAGSVSKLTHHVSDFESGVWKYRETAWMSDLHEPSVTTACARRNRWCASRWICLEIDSSCVRF